MSTVIKFHKKAGKAEIYIDVEKKHLAPFRIQNKLVFPDETEFDFIHDGEQFLAVRKRALTGAGDRLNEGFFGTTTLGAGSVISVDADYLASLGGAQRTQEVALQRSMDMRAFVTSPAPEPVKQIEAPKPKPKFESHYYFAGTDEEPFLVLMEDGIKAEFDKGEDEFYNALVPDHIKTLSALYNVPWRRQGDIFGVPLPHGMELNNKTDFTCRDVSILRTRHTSSKRAWVAMHELGKFQVVKGKIKAPDHEMQKWRDWHVVGQTKFLNNPRQAD